MNKAPGADTDRLRDRLLELRADAMRQLCVALPIIDGGLLRLCADASAVLAALDVEPERQEQPR